ncbi:MAG: helix-turn-helix transcriptional regulator [Clostridia bacterium]|nr:helix-turn-helix transcriptional regulator [Clostridia bacterium]
MKSCFDYASLGARIRKRRKQNRMTQEQLAEACDLSTAHIGHIERGTRAASIETLITISKALNISTDYLLLDIDLASDKRFTDLINSLNNISEEKYNTLYSVFKILAENADKL